MFSKLKQFKDLRDRAKHIQATLEQERIEGTSGWGKVKVTIDGQQKTVAVSIADELMSDREKLEGLIKDAYNDAHGKVQKVMAEKLKDLGGLDLAQEMQDIIKK